MSETLTCAFGVSWLEHFAGGRGCLLCAARVDELVAQFHTDVAAGRFDAAGYSAKERRAQQRRKGAGDVVADGRA